MNSMETWVFPGQGSQFPGMAGAYAVAGPLGQELLTQAENVSGVALRELTNYAGATTLADPHVAQLAVFVHSVGFGAELRRQGRQPAVVAGHSLGEYSALVASGALDWEYALYVVDARGRAMAEAARTTPGAMGAIVGPSTDEVATWCADADPKGAAVLANYNSPRQHVVSGRAEAVTEVLTRAGEAGAIRARRLPVGGAYHSPLMASAQEALAPLLRRAPLQAPKIPLVSSIDGTSVHDVEEYRGKLLTQICRPVRWHETVQEIATRRMPTVIEVGPGRVLSGLGRETLPDTEHTQAPRLLAGGGTTSRAVTNREGASLGERGGT